MILFNPVFFYIYYFFFPENPCKNGGFVAQDFRRGLYCDCPAPYHGTFCESTFFITILMCPNIRHLSHRNRNSEEWLCQDCWTEERVLWVCSYRLSKRVLKGHYHGHFAVF